MSGSSDGECLTRPGWVGLGAEAHRASRRAAALGLGVWLSAALWGCPANTVAEADAQPDVSGPVCAWDDSTDAATALPLALAEEVRGSLCPVDDEDWYDFDTGANNHLVTIALHMDGDLSPVQPAYAIWSKAADGAAGAVVTATPPDLIGGDLEVTHCMAPGPHFLVVRDSNQDGQDLRREYVLTVTAAPDPDPAEPNDDAGAAGALTSGQTVTGAIACRGDTDWFSLEVPAGSLLRLQLAAPKAGFEPTLRLYKPGDAPGASGDVLVEESNKSGRVRETAIDRYVVIGVAGTYYVSVGDDDGADADPAVSYTLTAEVLDDQDPNEPNQRPTEATQLAADPVACQAGWSSWVTASGTIGAPGDADWFRLPLAGCNPGLVEAEVTFDTAGLGDAAAWELQSQVQASVALIRADGETPCSDDADCQVLNRPCQGDIGCAGYGNTCLPEGLCAGAAACLAEGQCGARVVERHHQGSTVPSPIAGPPPPNEAKLSAPILTPTAIYLRVSDYQGNGAARDATYTLRVRVRSETDPNEPSNLFLPSLVGGFAAGPQEARATPMPVHRCIQPVAAGDPPADCCDGSNWVEGAIGYDNDLDWFSYDHPCPGEDCMVRVRYEVDAGAVDLALSIYRGKTMWFDGIGVPVESASHGSVSGDYGGLDPSDTCFYAYQGHTGTADSPFRYYLLARDVAEVVDHDPDQHFRLCVEKLADACVEPPCQDYTPVNGSGCGVPSEQ